jgi:hypothetical protein
MRLANGKFSDFFSSILPFILIVSDRLYALIFDGTPHIGELLGVIARFVDEECEVHQILLGVVHADKALNSAQLGGLLHEIVVESLQLTLKNCFGSMRDAASVNGALLEGISALLPNNTNVTCFSHMFNRVGACLWGPLLSAFMGAWSQHFGHSKNVLFHCFYFVICDLTKVLVCERLPRAIWCFP